MSLSYASFWILFLTWKNIETLKGTAVTFSQPFMSKALPCYMPVVDLNPNKNKPHRIPSHESFEIQN